MPDTEMENRLCSDDVFPTRGLETFNQNRTALFSIAYRMLGSVADAEDMVQETYLRWQQASADSIRSPRSFLVTVVSRLCINQLQSARARREEYPGQWLPEPVMTGPGSDPFGIVKTGEALSVAFLVLLERLTPTERAVFVLREVFEYEYAEVAEVIGQSEANCRQLLRRARQHLDTAHARFEASSEQHGSLLRKFLEAIKTGDMQGLLALLSDDVVLYADGGGKAVAVPNQVSGADKVTRGILGAFRRLVPEGLERRVAEINSGLGVVSYLDGRPYSVVTVEIGDGRIRGIYVLTNPEKLTHLPELPAN